MISNTVHATLISQISKPLWRLQEDHISSTVYILLIVHIPHTKTKTWFAADWKCLTNFEQRGFPKGQEDWHYFIWLNTLRRFIIKRCFMKMIKKKKSVVYLSCVTGSCQVLLNKLMCERGETPGLVTFFYMTSTEMSAVCQINMSYLKIMRKKGVGFFFLSLTRNSCF